MHTAETSQLFTAVRNVDGCVTASAEHGNQEHKVTDPGKKYSLGEEIFKSEVGSLFFCIYQKQKIRFKKKVSYKAKKESTGASVA